MPQTKQAILLKFYVARVVASIVLLASVSLANSFLTRHRKILSRGGVEIEYHGVRIVDVQEGACLPPLKHTPRTPFIRA